MGHEVLHAVLPEEESCPSHHHTADHLLGSSKASVASALQEVVVEGSVSTAAGAVALNVVATVGTATYAGALTALEVCGKIRCWTDPDVETAGTVQQILEQ